MVTEQLIKNYFLTKGKTVKAYLLGNEYKLFLTEEPSQKKEVGMLFYRFYYFIGVLIFLILFFSLINALDNVENFFFLLFIMLIGFPLLFNKPIVNFLSLENRRTKKNIQMYKGLYPNSNFKELTELPELAEFKEKENKKPTKGLIIAGVVGLLILLSFPLRALMGEKVFNEDPSDRYSRAKVESQNSNLISTVNKKVEREQDIQTNINSTPDKDKLIKKVALNSNELTEEELAELEAEHESDLMMYGEDFMTSKDEEIKDNSATITGTDIIIRDGHSTKSKIVGSFKEAGEKVIILGTYTSEERTVLIKNKIIVKDREGDDNILPKGKSVKILAINEEPPVEILISFKTKEGETKEGMVPENALDYINESWYKVKRDNGVTGWVFGKFIKLD